MMKKYKIFLIGVLSLLVFGLLLPQPIQAFMVLVESPIKDFFSQHSLLLCVAVGITQGLSEEGGYYLVFRTMLKKEKSLKTPIIFGLGRSSLHTIYDFVIIFATSMSVFSCLIAVGARLLNFGAMMGLTLIDYISITKKRVVYLVLSIVLHAIVNGVIYANELELLNGNNNFESMCMICFSCVVIIISVLICKNSLSEEA
jgi:uncharacterized membrane protein YhfC